MTTDFIALTDETTSQERAITIVLFTMLIAVTIGITIWASRQTKTAVDFHSGGRGFSGVQNGFAIGGDYMSAASFLGIAGIIALYGYDGFLYSIGFLVAWLVALLLVVAGCGGSSGEASTETTTTEETATTQTETTTTTMTVVPMLTIARSWSKTVCTDQ